MQGRPQTGTGHEHGALVLTKDQDGPNPKGQAALCLQSSAWITEQRVDHFVELPGKEVPAGSMSLQMCRGCLSPTHPQRCQLPNHPTQALPRTRGRPGQTSVPTAAAPVVGPAAGAHRSVPAARTPGRDA